MQKPKIIVIVGPTASGKTSLAIDIAKKYTGEVISADSRQVYRGLDIGTEKVTKTEMQGVPHHLIDIVDIKVVYNASDFKKGATKAIGDILERDNLPIIAGGTFFYIDTLLGKIIAPEVPPNQILRDELAKKPVDELYAMLLKKDPDRAETIEKDNPRRLIRAIEIATALGNVPVSEPVECPYDALMIGIDIDRETLRARIRARAEKALEHGLVAETQSLLESGVSPERLSEIGLEYRIVMEYIDGELTEAELIQKLEEKNWQYAKRQRTWLKRDESIVWTEPENRSAIFSLIDTFLLS